ncbi:DUF2637 domain-containing protein [Streptomyces goshikiensis]|uniref:DUF2637 domain-containing protein n=1 Tax=Streptomyces goshikiensis TaxID=1942 RepID=UPI0036784F9E
MYDSRDFSGSGLGATDGHYPEPEAVWAGSLHTVPHPHGQQETTFGAAGPDFVAQQWSPEEELAQLLAQAQAQAQEQEQEQEPRTASRSRHDRRRRRRRLSAAVLSLRAVSMGAAALVALLVAMVSVLSGVVAYDPLHLAAAQSVSRSPAALWPMLVYGPWAAASLSILRAALHRKRAVHSWAVVLLFSAAAVALSVTQAPHTVTGLAAAGLPPVAALTCFQQLVRQITLTRPLHRQQPRRRNAHAARASAR